MNIHTVFSLVSETHFHSFMSTHTPKKLASVGSVRRIYWHYTRKHLLAFVLVVAGSFGVQMADLATPWFLKQFLNLLATHKPSTVLAGAVLTIVVLVGLSRLCGWVFRRVQSRGIMRLELAVMAELYDHSFGYLLKHSHSFFGTNFTGSLTSKVGKFSGAYESIADSVLLEFFPTAVFVIGAVIILGLQHWTLGAVLAVWSILFLGFQIVMARRLVPLRVARAAASTAATGALADAISNQHTVTLFSGFAFETARFKDAITKWKNATSGVWFTDDNTWGMMGLMVIGINVAMLYMGGVLWTRGVLTVGDIMLLQTYLLGTFDRLFSINRVLRRFYDTLADAQEMVAILETPHEVQDAPKASALVVDHGEVSFRDVSFSFDQERPILSHLNLTIEPGQRVAFVGPSGAGKSTITKLLLRLFDVKAGSIEVDGQNIATVTQDSLRDAISFVPQEPILFHRSLRENIRYGKRDATEDEIIEAAKQANCHDFILSLPEGYDTFVGERGVKLSGGERQRVAIARAILKNVPILVLDEATSSLDSESEQLLQQALEVLMQGKTVLVVAHRLSTIMKMDRIVVIQNGAVVADGTHDELLQEEGLYQKLWSIQAGGFIADEDETLVAA